MSSSPLSTIARASLLILSLSLIGAGCQSKNNPASSNDSDTMSLSSPAFRQNQPIPNRYTCKGVNVNPPLTINNVPNGTKSLTLLVQDPDGHDWIHWMAWNIPPNTHFIEEKNVPIGAVEGKNDFKSIGYGGPCPPSGTHRYIFRLYALDSPLNSSPSASWSAIKQAMEGHVLDATELTGTFKAE